MEEHKRKIRSDIMKRVKILYGVFVIVALCVLVRIGYVQFGSRETRINAERLHRRLVFVDSLKAHRGSILARDGRPLATSIFRKSIYFDFGSEGFDKREAFLENADSLSKLLARYFGDKSAREYYNKMVSERDRCFKVKYMGTCSVLMSQGKLARWFDRMRGKEYMVVKRYDTTRRHSYTKLFRDVDFNEWQTLREYPILDESTLGRVYLTEVFDHRVYPHDELALRTIGRTDKKRPYGIEEAYKKELQGRNGYQWLQCIAPGFYSRVEGADFREPEDGCDVVTTLDADVQDVADKALRTQISKQNAIWGTSIVMECATGDILAMANIGRSSDGRLVENRNYAIGQRMEPGSTFKLAVLMALLEDRHLPTSTIYDSGKGKTVAVGKSKVKVRDSHNVGGRIDMRTAFAQSANVYFSKAIYDAYSENPQAYVDFLRSLHLDRTAGLERLGEVKPVLPAPGDKNWYRHATLAYMGYGYGLELAPIQTLTLYNAVANGGKMVAPRLVSRIMRGDKVVEEFPTQVLIDRICSQATLDTVRMVLEEAALNGTGKELFGEKESHFRVGAKTGTATISQGGVKYSDGYYFGSMVAYLPADKPKYTVMTAIYTNRKNKGQIYGAKLAGPVVKRIATFLYNRQTKWTGEELDDSREYYPTDIKGGNIAEIRRVASRLSPRTEYDSRSGWGRAETEPNSTVVISSVDSHPRIMPDVKGMGLSDALFILENRGLKVSFSGSGKVVSQSIAAGKEIKRGDYVSLRFE